MPRGASSTAGRKLKGEEKNKAKWMNEAKRNKKRAEEAEEKLAMLQAKLSDAPPITPDADDVVPVSVSRSEFDALKAQLEAVKSAHHAALHEKQLAETTSNNERGVLQASLDFAQGESKKLMEQLSKAKKAEQVARSLFEQTNKANLEKEKTIQELAASNINIAGIGGTTPNVTTPAFDVILDASPSGAKNVSPITPERLDFSDNSPLSTPNERGIDIEANTTTANKKLLACNDTHPKPTSLLQKIQKWIANLLNNIRALFTGQRQAIADAENTPLLHIAV